MLTTGLVGPIGWPGAPEAKPWAPTMPRIALVSGARK